MLYHWNLTEDLSSLEKKSDYPPQIVA